MSPTTPRKEEEEEMHEDDMHEDDMHEADGIEEMDELCVDDDATDASSVSASDGALPCEDLLLRLLSAVGGQFMYCWVARRSSGGAHCGRSPGPGQALRGGAMLRVCQHPSASRAGWGQGALLASVFGVFAAEEPPHRACGASVRGPQRGALHAPLLGLRKEGRKADQNAQMIPKCRVNTWYLMFVKSPISTSFQITHSDERGVGTPVGEQSWRDWMLG